MSRLSKRGRPKSLRVGDYRMTAKRGPSGQHWYWFLEVKVEREWRALWSGWATRDEAERILQSAFVDEAVTQDETPRGIAAGFVYFVEAQGLNAVKIGFSAREPTLRIESLQTACPMPLVPLGAIRGTVRDERLLHARFREHHLRGEWYALTPHMRDQLEELLRERPAPESR
jgi:hypothetical protein